MLSKILVCFNCKFKKTLKNEATAAIIIRNHNEGRDVFETKHVLRLMEQEELKAVTGLPYYDGNVFRSICNCGTILDRKTIPGIEYAMAQHMITGEETNRIRERNSEPLIEHEFQKTETDTETINIRTIKRSEYLSGSKNEEILLQESMALYGIERNQLSKSTDIQKFDQDLFWISNKSQHFNRLNYIVFRFLRFYNCIYCGSDDGGNIYHEGEQSKHRFNSFRELYWHFYREHYIKEPMTAEERDRWSYLIREIGEMEYNLQTGYTSSESNRRWYQELLAEYQDELKLLEKKKRFGFIQKDDTCLSMLQQLVLVEDGIDKNRKNRKYSFKHDRSSSALYQLNRKHGISFEDLSELFFESKDRTKLGAKLFHGMVWSEDKAPDWLENVINTMGSELDI